MHGEITNVGFTNFSELRLKIKVPETPQWADRLGYEVEEMGIAYQCLTCGSMVIDRGKHELFFHR